MSRTSACLWMVLAVACPARAGDDARKEEAVDLDALDDDKPSPSPSPSPAPTAAPPVDGGKLPERTHLPASALPATGSVVEREVNLDDIDAEEGGVPEYDRRPWLRWLALLPLLVVAWNVDWRDARVKREIAAARHAHAPKSSTTSSKSKSAEAGARGAHGHG